MGNGYVILISRLEERLQLVEIDCQIGYLNRFWQYLDSRNPIRISGERQLSTYRSYTDFGAVRRLRHDHQSPYSHQRGQSFHSEGSASHQCHPQRGAFQAS